jgi:hypothetical protein
VVYCSCEITRQHRKLLKKRTKKKNHTQIHYEGQNRGYKRKYQRITDFRKYLEGRIPVGKW